MLKTSCLKWNAKIKCQGRVRKSRNPGSHEVWEKLPPGSQAWHSCLEPEEGGRPGKDDSVPHMVTLLDGHGISPVCSTWKIAWVFSESTGAGNGFSAVKWKGQAHLGNPEYHLFLEACLTDGRSVDLSGSEPFWATWSASNRSKTGVPALGALLLADALCAWRPLGLATHGWPESKWRSGAHPSQLLHRLNAKEQVLICEPVHACMHTHTHTCVHAHTHRHKHMRMHTHAHAHTHAHMHAHAHTRSHARAHTCASTHVHMHTCTHTYVHTHARTHAHARTCTSFGARHSVFPFLHSQIFGKKQTFSSASISSPRNPAAPPDPQEPPSGPRPHPGSPSEWALAMAFGVHNLPLSYSFARPCFCVVTFVPQPCCWCRCQSGHPPIPQDPRHLSCSPPSAPPSSLALGSLSLARERRLLTLSCSVMCTRSPCYSPSWTSWRNIHPASLTVLSCPAPSSLFRERRCIHPRCTQKVRVS